MEHRENICSTVSFIPERNEGSIMLLDVRKYSSLLAKNLWKSCEMTDVRPIERKFAG